MYQGLSGLIQMLPRHSTPLALLLVILGMFWLGDACCDYLMDTPPVGATEFVRSNVDTSNKQHHATVFIEQIVTFEKQADAHLSGIFAPETTERIRLRPRKHSVRGPPFVFT